MRKYKLLFISSFKLACLALLLTLKAQRLLSSL